MDAFSFNAEPEYDGNFGHGHTIEHLLIVRKTDATLERKMLPLEHGRWLFGIHTRESVP